MNYPSELTAEEIWGAMTATLRRYLAAHGFRHNLHLKMEVDRQEQPGMAIADVNTRFAVTAPVDLSDWPEGVEAASRVPGLAEAMWAYSEALSGQPYPLARLYWAYDVLQQEEGGEAALRARVGWAQRRIRSLKRALQHHRHPNSPLSMTEAKCRTETRQLILDYAQAHHHPLKS